MNNISCKQVRVGLEQSQWRRTDRLVQFIHTKYTGTTTTLPCEEMVGAAKNYQTNKMTRRYRRPETCTQFSDYKVDQQTCC